MIYWQKKYHFLLHRLLLEGVTEDVFMCITKLTNEQKQLMFSLTKNEIRKIIECAGFIYAFQRIKRGMVSNSELRSQFLMFNNHIPTELRLWSDTIDFVSMPEIPDINVCGLLFLSLYNRPMALVWSKILKIDLPNIVMDLKHPQRLYPVFERLILASKHPVMKVANVN
ncbi:hypothetical protein CHN45_17200 [Vibrio cholerae]|nr:hypothetical protein CHN45_17200 [Vibrio cholerae]